MTTGIDAAKKTVIKAGLELVREGLVARSWGNISVRIDEGTMAITPSGIKYEDLRPEHIVLVDILQGAYQGTVKPSGEKKLHMAIYRLRPEINAVIHTHQQKASTCAAARIDVPVLDRKLVKILNAETVYCGNYGLPGTSKLTRETVNALGCGRTALMANHGAVCAGRDIREAFAVARALEKACGDCIARKFIERSRKARFSEKAMLEYFLSDSEIRK